MPTHSRPAEGGSRQAGPTIQRVVSPSGGLPSNTLQAAEASNRLICLFIQQQVAVVSPVPDPLATAVVSLSLPW